MEAAWRGRQLHELGPATSLWASISQLKMVRMKSLLPNIYKGLRTEPGTSKVQSMCVRACVRVCVCVHTRVCVIRVIKRAANCRL